MKTERQKQINLDAVIKVQAFLENVKKRLNTNRMFSIYQLAKRVNISGSIGTVAIELGYVIKGDIQGQYSFGENFGTDETHAKKLIETLRLKKVKQKNDKISKSLDLYSDTSRMLNDNNEHEQSLPGNIKFNTGRNIESILKNGFASLQKNESLFSEQEKEFEDKLKIACAIASGMYSDPNNTETPYGQMNEIIIRFANDLYNQLKNDK